MAKKKYTAAILNSQLLTLCAVRDSMEEFDLPPGSAARDVAMTATKLDEAIMWLRSAQNKVEEKLDSGKQCGSCCMCAGQKAA